MSHQRLTERHKLPFYVFYTLLTVSWVTRDPPEVRAWRRAIASLSTHPQEDVFGRVEAGGVDAGGVGRVALAHHPAGEAGDGAGGHRGVLALLAAARRVRHHEVDGALRGPPDLFAGGRPYQ